VGVFFFLSFPFLSFSFLFSFFLFKLRVHLMWSFCDCFGGLKFFLDWEPGSLELSDVHWNRIFFPFWSFFLLGIGFAIVSHQSIEKGLYILLFLYLQNFKWGFINNLVLLDWWSPSDLSISVWHIAHHVELRSAGSISI
jgi:hypothetical protein